MTVEPFVTASAPAGRIHPDSRSVVVTTVWLVAILALVSFILGVPGLVAVGAWAGLPSPLRWGVPLMLDGGLVVMALVATVRRARLENARFAWACLAILTIASMGIQIAHVASESGEGWQQAVGMALAAAFPAVVFASTHSLLDLAVAPAPTKKKNGARKASSVVAQKPKGVVVSKAKPTHAQEASLISANAVQSTDVAAADKATTRTLMSSKSPGRGVLMAQVLELRGQGLSYAEVSARTGVALSTVKRWASQAA